ncbi:MAG: hypothetical protein IJW55_08585 [Clostridia bacterium]|nr:hypothetical protein [Clostridia bacterium]
MKKQLLRGVLLLVSLVLLLAACSKTPALDYANGVFTNKKTGVSYLPAPACYKAQTLVQANAVAKISYSEMDDMILYEIENADTAKYLTNDSYQLFYASTVTLPELWEMSTDKVNVVRTGTISYANVSITEAEDIAALIDAYQNGVHFSEDEIDVNLTPARYDLEFASSVYPAFYYTLTYWQYDTEVLVYELIEDADSATPTYAGVEVTYEDYEGETYAVYHFGKNLLYNRTTGECYPIGNTVSKYLG